MLRVVTILIALAAIALPAWAVSRAGPMTDAIHLLKLGEASCRCARETDDAAAKTACWQPLYDKVQADPKMRMTYESCAPLQTRNVCLADGHCFVAEYRSIVSPASFCTLAEARAAEAIYASPGGMEDAFKAIDALSRDYATRDHASTVATPQGCSG